MFKILLLGYANQCQAHFVCLSARLSLCDEILPIDVFTSGLSADVQWSLSLEPCRATRNSHRVVVLKPLYHCHWLYVRSPASCALGSRLSVRMWLHSAFPEF